MKSCPHTQDYIARHLDGSLGTAELEALRDHLRVCPACEAAFAQMNLLGEIVKDALQTDTSQVQAAERVTARLIQEQTTSRHANWGPNRVRQWMAAAALLLIGTGLGLLWRPQETSLPVPPERTPVAVKIGQCHGTVLVKHRDEQLWHPVDVNTPVYIGDTFHTTHTASVILALSNTNHIDVAPNSMLTLVSYDTTTEFYLEHGQCTPVLNGPHGPFFIETPNGRLEAVGTEFTVKVTE